MLEIIQQKIKNEKLSKQEIFNLRNKLIFTKAFLPEDFVSKYLTETEHTEIETEMFNILKSIPNLIDDNGFFDNGIYETKYYNYQNEIDEFQDLFTNYVLSQKVTVGGTLNNHLDNNNNNNSIYSPAGLVSFDNDTGMVMYLGGTSSSAGMFTSFLSENFDKFLNNNTSSSLSTNYKPFKENNNSLNSLPITSSTVKNVMGYFNNKLKTCYNTLNLVEIVEEKNNTQFVAISQ
jgi:hypothetical protein